MPVILSEELIKKEILEKEDIFTIDKSRAKSQDIRPLKIAIVNLMPNKEETEIDLLKLISNHALQIEVDFIRTDSYINKHSNYERLNKLYKSYEDIKNEKYDGMIITGAPIENLDYSDIKYWDELKMIFDYARENVFSTIFICWASLAALNYFYHIDSFSYKEKIFGVYPFFKESESRLLDGFDDVFNIPQSRYKGIDPKDIELVDDLKILGESDEVGLSLAASCDYRFIFSLGHFEYNKYTLDREYKRDLKNGLDAKKPVNYYFKDSDKINMSWKSAASLFFSNWINYAVYQNTPYRLDSIKEKSVSKFGGSSLSDAGQFRRVKEIINKKDDRNVIVVSAPGKRNPYDIKVTDLLIKASESNEKINNIDKEILRLSKVKNEEIEIKNKILEKIRERFYEIVDDLDLNKNIKKEIDDCIISVSESLNKDFNLSRGEYLNAKILALYLDYDFIDSKDLIYFDEDNKVNFERTTEAIRKNIRAGMKVVVPGFYGNKDGHIKTFERGGSDYTGSILASALDSSVYENWTDVSGIMTADPNIDKTAKKIEKLKYKDLEKIINSGASVYQKDAIAPVMDKNITIKILNTNKPDDSGTTIKD
ncbi:homoserine O-succinyltransferase [Anaerococcus porci]|uniref:homoserine O-acetyltransferase/O-succinyltransferase family protein n=1 Tax=Anaerococcus porci TaxID=2652269 RepID=UPI002A761258|nr:homoserine O-succinyltransferase [Anaerococcus porci]MDY3005574.1 homoserine O-succinyltransferase [Anaerococcus porci]